MKKMIKQPLCVRNDWNDSLTVGDRVYSWITANTAVMDDMVKSKGKDKAVAGKLTPRRVTKDGWDRLAVVKDGVWYWID